MEVSARKGTRVALKPANLTRLWLHKVFSSETLNNLFNVTSDTSSVKSVKQVWRHLKQKANTEESK